MVRVPRLTRTVMIGAPDPSESVCMKLFVFGLGYSSLRLLDLYADRFERISGTVRRPEKREQLRQFGRHPHLSRAPL